MGFIIYYVVILIAYFATKIYFQKVVEKKINNIYPNFLNDMRICKIKYFIEEYLANEETLQNEGLLKLVKEDYIKANEEIKNKINEIDENCKLLEKKANDYKFNILILFFILEVLSLYFLIKENYTIFFVTQLIIYSKETYKQVNFSFEKIKQIKSIRDSVNRTLVAVTNNIDKIVEYVDKKDIKSLVKIIKKE